MRKPVTYDKLVRTCCTKTRELTTGQIVEFEIYWGNTSAGILNVGNGLPEAFEEEAYPPVYLARGLMACLGENCRTRNIRGKLNL
jgi:hypothetical protein